MMLCIPASVNTSVVITLLLHNVIHWKTATSYNKDNIDDVQRFETYPLNILLLDLHQETRLSSYNKLNQEEIVYYKKRVLFLDKGQEAKKLKKE